MWLAGMMAGSYRRVGPGLVQGSGGEGENETSEAKARAGLFSPRLRPAQLFLPAWLPQTSLEKSGGGSGEACDSCLSFVQRWQGQSHSLDYC